MTAAVQTTAMVDLAFYCTHCQASVILFITNQQEWPWRRAETRTEFNCTQQ